MEMSLNSASIKTQKSPCEHFPNTRRYTFFISYTPHAFDYWDFETSVTWPPEIDCHQNVPIYNILQFHTTLQIRIQENMMNWWTFCYVYIVHHLNFMNVLMFSGVDVEPNLSLSSLSQDHLFSISSSCFQFGRRKIKIIVFFFFSKNNIDLHIIFFWACLVYAKILFITNNVIISYQCAKISSRS